MDCLLEIKGYHPDSSGKMGQPKYTRTKTIREWIVDSDYIYRCVYNHVKDCPKCNPREVINSYIDRRDFFISAGLLKLAEKYGKLINDSSVYLEVMSRCSSSMWFSARHVATPAIITEDDLVSLAKVSKIVESFSEDQVENVVYGVNYLDGSSFHGMDRLVKKNEEIGELRGGGADVVRKYVKRMPFEMSMMAAEIIENSVMGWMTLRTKVPNISPIRVLEMVVENHELNRKVKLRLLKASKNPNGKMSDNELLDVLRIMSIHDS